MVKVTATVAESDIPNKNRRIYPKKILESMIDKFIPKTIIGQLGEVDQKDPCVIYLSKASHMINEMKLEDNKLVVEIETLKTEQGNLLKEMIENNSVSFSMVGVGNGKIDENKHFVIDESYKLVTINAYDKKSGL